MVPAPANGCFDLGARRHLFDPESVMEHLNVDAELVHVLQPKLDVVQLTSRLRCRDVSPGSIRKIPELLFRQRRKTKPTDFVVDNPILPRLVLGCIEKPRAILTL